MKLINDEFGGALASLKEIDVIRGWFVLLDLIVRFDNRVSLCSFDRVLLNVGLRERGKKPDWFTR